MKIQYGVCTNSPYIENKSSCDWRCRTHTCLNFNDIQQQKVEFYVYGKHNTKKLEKNQRGITEKVKELIEITVNEYDNKK